MSVCSWCWLDTKTGIRLTEEEYKKTTLPEANVNHTICPTCLNKKLHEMEMQNMEQATGKLTGRHK